jgi:hypothetical protein
MEHSTTTRTTSNSTDSTCENFTTDSFSGKVHFADPVKDKLELQQLNQNFYF